MKILITDPVDASCIEILKEEGFDVDYSPGISPEEIQKKIVDVEAMIVRSSTNVTREVLTAGQRLKAVGRAGAGVDNIDVQTATRRGIIVMNTPGGNTISTAEHTISMMLALARNIPQAHQSVVEGKWERKKFVGSELYGKTIGIVGLGKVGSEVARRCLAFEMNVVAYDPILSSEAASKLGIALVTLQELYERSDIITVHSPLTEETKGLIGESALLRCKRGVKVINCARGGIVDEQALLNALNDGRVSGAALDVFENEPPVNFPLLKHPHVIVTPHLGASTEEAQEKVAIQIAHQIADVLKGRGISGSVNADIIAMAMRDDVRPFFELAEKLGKLIAQLLDGNLRTITVGVTGEMLHESLHALGAAVLKGILEARLDEPINYLNAPIIARERGIGLQFHQDEKHDLYSNVLSVGYGTEQERQKFSGTVFGNRDVRIISIDKFHFEIKPEGHLLFYSNIDRPGMLAAVGGILARHDINIGGLSLGRYGPGEKALTVISVDNPVSKQILAEIAKLEGVSDVRLAVLST
jgi:D-3-phosphoglycerate dehydrogenase